MNIFFPNPVKTLRIPPYEDPAVDTSDISDPFLKAIVKYKKHPSARLTKKKNWISLVFNMMVKQILGKNHEFEYIQRFLRFRDPSQITKESLDFCKEILCQECNRSIKTSRLRSLMELANIILVFKKFIQRVKQIIDQLVYCKTCQKY